MKKNKNAHQCVIIGSGPAGYTGAIYAARAELSPILFTGLQMGGQLTTTTDVENFPGFPDGIDGNMLMSHMENQARRFGTDIRMNKIVSAEFAEKKGDLHILQSDNGEKILAQTVIIATGASAKWLGVKGEDKLKGFGVSACAICDGFFFKNQVVAVVGGGDAALEEASYLSKICSKVYLLIRRDVMRASKAMQTKVLSNKKIEVLWNTHITEIYGDKSVEGINVVNSQTSSMQNLALNGVFIAIGHHPNSEIFSPQVKTKQGGYIVTDGITTETNLPGVFAAGDVADSRYAQAVTSAGSGCRAALDAEKYLLEI